MGRAPQGRGFLPLPPSHPAPVPHRPPRAEEPSPILVPDTTREDTPESCRNRIVVKTPRLSFHAALPDQPSAALRALSADSAAGLALGVLRPLGRQWNDSMPEADAEAPLVDSCLCIAGFDFDVEACTRAIGLAPTRVWRQKRDHIRTSHPDILTTNWLIETGKQPCYEISDSVQMVLNLVLPRRVEILNYCAANSLTVSFLTTVNIHENRPLYELRPEVLRELAAFDAPYALDIYDYSGLDA
jgi:hypothetical protein